MVDAVNTAEDSKEQMLAQIPQHQLRSVQNDLPSTFFDDTPLRGIATSTWLSVSDHVYSPVTGIVVLG